MGAYLGNAKTEKAYYNSNKVNGYYRGIKV